MYINVKTVSLFNGIQSQTKCEDICRTSEFLLCYFHIIYCFVNFFLLIKKMNYYFLYYNRLQNELNSIVRHIWRQMVPNKGISRTIIVLLL